MKFGSPLPEVQMSILDFDLRDADYIINDAENFLNLCGQELKGVER